MRCERSRVISIWKEGTADPIMESMSATAVVTMILILGFVWGGLGIILFTAIRRERAKSTYAEPTEHLP